MAAVARPAAGPEAARAEAHPWFRVAAEPRMGAAAAVQPDGERMAAQRAARVQRPAEAEPAARPWRGRPAEEAEAPGAAPAGRHGAARPAAGRPRVAEPGAKAARRLEAQAAARPWFRDVAGAARPDAAVARLRAAEAEGPEQPRAEAAQAVAAARPAAERPCGRPAGPARPEPGPSAPARHPPLRSPQWRRSTPAPEARWWPAEAVVVLSSDPYPASLTDRNRRGSNPDPSTSNLRAVMWPRRRHISHRRARHSAHIHRASSGDVIPAIVDGVAWRLTSGRRRQCWHIAHRANLFGGTSCRLLTGAS